MFTIGIIPNSSSDGFDAVLTDFRGSVNDISDVSLPFPVALKKQLTKLRAQVRTLDADMKKVSQLPLFTEVLDALTTLQVKAVHTLLQNSHLAKEDVSAIGIAGLKICDGLTIQIFNPAKLAKETGIDVVYNFTADETMDDPFMPIHLLHISSAFAVKRDFPVCFISGGKTAHMTLITEGNTSIKRHIISFDCGPLNYYVDALNKKDNDSYSFEGEINTYLLAELYNKSALLPDGANYYDLPLPKVVDENYYGMSDVLNNYPLQDEDVLRTVRYFAAYVAFMSLRFIPDNVDFPNCFVVFGKGWDNSLIYHDFQNLLHGRGVILPEHEEIYAGILAHMRGLSFSFGNSDMFGISSQYMEARAFADMAYCCLDNKLSTVKATVCHAGENTRRRGIGFTYSI